MPYLFTSESVSEGHPDKVADQISDALIDHFLAFDPQSKVACETLVTTGQVVLAGEVKSNAYLDVQEIARSVIRKIGYTKSEYMFEANSCGIFSANCSIKPPDYTNAASLLMASTQRWLSSSVPVEMRIAFARPKLASGRTIMPWASRSLVS